MLKQELTQRIGQRISPQQLQQIRLVELPTLEFEERIKKELEENPALEEGHEPDDVRAADESGEEYASDEDTLITAEEMMLGDYRSEEDIPNYKLQDQQERISDDRRERMTTPQRTLYDHLLEQLSELTLSEEQQTIAEQIIGNIDQSGYLRYSDEEIADDLYIHLNIDATPQEIAEITQKIRGFDPAGVGARDLRDTLMLQLERAAHRTREVENAYRIVNERYELFANHMYDTLMSALKLSEEELREAINEIAQLNPKPGNSWSNGELDISMQVVPDFYIENNNGELSLQMNGNEVPPLRVSDEYRQLLKEYQSDKKERTGDRRQTLLFIKQKMDSAQWFIDAVRQRQETLQRTMSAILEFQYDYFMSGEDHDRRPMILKDIAARTGYNISTISRVSNSKYVSCDWGILPLKSLFSESMQRETGEEVSNLEIKALLKELIENEDKHKPSPDELLAQQLKAKGYVIARRTVMKYREQLGYPIARLRKVL